MAHVIVYWTDHTMTTIDRIVGIFESMREAELDQAPQSTIYELLAPGADFIPWGKIHTQVCMDQPDVYTADNCFVGDRERGCICDGIRTFIRKQDEPDAATWMEPSTDAPTIKRREPLL